MMFSFVFRVFWIFTVVCVGINGNANFQSSNPMLFHKTLISSNKKYSDSLESNQIPIIDYNRPLRTEGMTRLDNRNTFGELQSSFIRPKPRCNRRIRIANGVTRFRDKGSFVRFQCSHGFTLLGTTIAVCLRDQWSEPLPICVKPGCRRIQVPVNGQAQFTFSGSVVSFFCKGNYELDGSPLLFCDGNRWNGTEPICFSMEPPNPTTEEPDEPKWYEGSYTESDLSPETTTNANQEAWDLNIIQTTLQEIQTSIVEVETTKSPPLNATTSNSNQTALIVSSSTLTPEMYNWDQVSNFSNELEKYNETITTVNNPNSSSTTSNESTSVNIPSSTTIASNTVTTTDNFDTYSTLSISSSPKSTYFPVTFEPIAKTPSAIKVTATTPLTAKINRGQLSSTQIVTIFPVSSRTTSVDLSTIQEGTTETWEDPFPDGTFDKFDEELGFTYTFDTHTRTPEFIQPLSPHRLDDDYEHYKRVAHFSLIGGVILAILGSIALVGGFTVYCWRKNHGIARANPYDLDGRTLSASDANEDFMWMDTARV